MNHKSSIPNKTEILKLCLKKPAHFNTASGRTAGTSHLGSFPASVERRPGRGPSRSPSSSPSVCEVGYDCGPGATVAYSELSGANDSDCTDHIAFAFFSPSFENALRNAFRNTPLNFQIQTTTPWKCQTPLKS